MSQHNKIDFRHFTKAQMDAGLKLYGLEVKKPSQLSDAFRSGADWGAGQPVTSEPSSGERERFEAWARKQGYQYDELDRCKTGIVSPEYYNLNTEMAWRAWQAALLSSDAKPASDPCGCRVGECETKAGRLCRMTAEIAENHESVDPLKLHAIEELCQLGYVVKDGVLYPPDHLGALMAAAGHPLAESVASEPVAVPQDVLAALDRMCTPLHESRLSGATAEADTRCMKLIRDYVLSAAPSPAPVGIKKENQ